MLVPPNIHAAGIIMLHALTQQGLLRRKLLSAYSLYTNPPSLNQIQYLHLTYLYAVSLSIKAGAFWQVFILKIRMLKC